MRFLRTITVLICMTGSCLSLASEESGISEALFASVDEHVRNSLLYRVSKKVYTGELIPPGKRQFHLG